MTCLRPFGTSSMRFLVPNLRGSVLLEMPFSFHLSDWTCPVFMSASLDMSNFSFGKCDMSNFWVGKCDMSNFALCKIGHVTFLRFLQKLNVFEKNRSARTSPFFHFENLDMSNFRSGNLDMSSFQFGSSKGVKLVSRTI